MMKRNLNSLKLVVALCFTILLLTLSLFTKPQAVQPAAVGTGSGIILQPPAFLKSAHAQDSTQIDFGFLIEEAGITAYTKLSDQVDLIALKSSFKSIRQMNDQFIIGIVIAPGYEDVLEFDENADVQVFVHRDGWILGYLTKWQPASTLFDWVNYDQRRLTGTPIENVVRLLAENAGVSNFNIDYYDFRYPDATNLLLAADRIPETTNFNNSRSDSFEISIPRQLTTYDISWSHAALGSKFSEDHLAEAGRCEIDDESLSWLDSDDSTWGIATGELNQTSFRSGVKHVLVVSGYGISSYCGIAIVYKD